MDRKLPPSAIRYLSYHLGHHYSGPDLNSILVTEEKETDAASFCMPQSGLPLDTEKVFFIEEVPVLFPLSRSKAWYAVKEKGIRFNHDILKSAFYLLSGIQEYLDYMPDTHGRFPWHESIQYRLGFTGKPVVNYYFEIILDALETYCSLNHLPFKRVKLEQPVLLLSHDVDRIRKYSLRELVYVGLQLAGLKPSGRSFAKKWRSFLFYARGTFLFRKDPYWNFEDLLAMEKEYRISSSWYFLEKTGNGNSRYHFGDPKIAVLLRQIKQPEHEIGIHGTRESSTDILAMAEGIKRLNRVTAHPVSGIRQHFLKFNIRTTPGIQISAGLTYDTTLGFAECIGFRNSYAFPFRLYDFHEHRPMDIWQIPLNVMDTTLLEYMSVPVESLMEAIQPVLTEVSRFHGLFSLLWHNSTLDEEEYRGVGPKYRQILEHLTAAGFKSFTGAQMVSRWKTMEA
ncbi:MAG: polysaccharide deacetylase family protein [Bacteroidota bacterium]